MPVAEQFKLDLVFSKLGGLTRVALAVSGGSDSMAMLRMVLEWALAHEHSPEIIVLTVDHGLRDASAGEALQVKYWCDALGLRHETLQWHGEKPKTGIQAKARQARYDLMTAWCLKHDVSVLLTAHTADDQAETVAMRIKRTSSAKSLAGIWPERDWNGVSVQRHLLGTRREVLRDYLKTIGQAWLEDPSNDDRRFERVRVRLDEPSDHQMLVARAQQALQIVKGEAEKAALWWESEIIIADYGYAIVMRGAFTRLEAALQDETLVRLLAQIGGGGSAELAERQRLVDWLVIDGGGQRTLGGVIIAKRKDLIWVGRESGRIASDRIIIPTGGSIVWDGRFKIDGPAGAEVLPVVKVKDVERNRGIPAFVQAGLPAIIKNGQIWSIPHLGIGNDVFVKFLGH